MKNIREFARRPKRYLYVIPQFMLRRLGTNGESIDDYQSV